MSEGKTLIKGSYTGLLCHSKNFDGCIASVTHYPVGNDEGGWHCHENAHIDFVFQGGDIEKRENGSFERKPGVIDFYYSGEFHETIFRNEYSKSLILELEHSFLDKYDLLHKDLATSIKRNYDARLLSIKMVDELLNYDSCSQLSLISSYLCLLAGSENRIYTAMPSWIKILVELLNDKWDEQITLHELSVASGVHPVTISKYFRKYFSCTFGEYLRKLRITHSIGMIKSNDTTLTDIAFKCGFSDQSHFTRTFKQLTGVLPKDFRKF